MDVMFYLLIQNGVGAKKNGWLKNKDQARCEDTAGQSYSIGLTILISRHQKSSVTVLPCVTGVLSRLAALTVKAADLILFAFRDSFASK